MGGGKSSLGQGFQQLGNNFKAGIGALNNNINQGGEALGNNITSGLHELGANAQGAASQFANNTKGFSWDPSQGTLGAIAQGFGNGGNFSKAGDQLGGGLSQIAKGGAQFTEDVLAPPLAIAGAFDQSKQRTAANQAKVQGQDQAQQQQNQANAVAASQAAQQATLSGQQQQNQAGFNQANSLEDALRAAMQQRAGANANANGF